MQIHRRRAEGGGGRPVRRRSTHRDHRGEPGEISIEELIAEEDMAITVSNTGYIKRTAISTYRNQRRGGKGASACARATKTFVSHLFVASDARLHHDLHRTAAAPTG
jgi:DNA gyrase/topoisomerase IV subunit A